VVSEPKPGLVNARLRGFAEAAHDIVSFIDDDNWVCPEWTVLVGEIMAAQPDVAALGAHCEAECAQTPPAWFEAFSRSYAIGGMADAAADVTRSKGYLYGAGLSVRKSAWQAVQQKGFTPLLMDRTGSALTSGGDGEICKTLILAGWRLYYDPRLRLRHYITADRLNWNYLRRLRHGMGAASPLVDCYTFASRRSRLPLAKAVKENWIFQIFCTIGQLATCGAMSVSAKARDEEGSARALHAEWQLGRLGTLWKMRGDYDRSMRRIRSAPWRNLRQPSR
jgi:hypothetical protein